jgi:hypothetical protein
MKKIDNGVKCWNIVERRFFAQAIQNKYLIDEVNAFFIQLIHGVTIFIPWVSPYQI